MTDAMEMPCECGECGEPFDLHDGNPCGRCENVYCTNCVPEPWDRCPVCADQSTGERNG